MVEPELSPEQLTDTIIRTVLMAIVQASGGVILTADALNKLPIGQIELSVTKDETVYVCYRPKKDAGLIKEPYRLALACLLWHHLHGKALKLLPKDMAVTGTLMYQFVGPRGENLELWIEPGPVPDKLGSVDTQTPVH